MRYLALNLCKPFNDIGFRGIVLAYFGISIVCGRHNSVFGFRKRSTMTRAQSTHGPSIHMYRGPWSTSFSPAFSNAKKYAYIGYCEW